MGQNDRQIEDNLTRDCVTYFCPGHLNKFKDRKLCFTTKTITYLTFSPDGSELLVNMGSEHLYLYDLNNAQQPVVGPKPNFDKCSILSKAMAILFNYNLYLIRFST